MVWDDFVLIEAPDAFSEDIMVLAEDPTCPDVRQVLGTGGLWTGDGLPEMLGLM